MSSVDLGGLRIIKKKENAEGAIKNEQSRETGNIGYTRRRKTQYVLDTNRNEQTQTKTKKTGI